MRNLPGLLAFSILLLGAISAGTVMVAGMNGSSESAPTSTPPSQANTKHMAEAYQTNPRKAERPAVSRREGDVEGPIQVTVDVIAPGGLSRKTQLRVSVVSRIDLKELRITPVPPADFERTTDKWSFKPVRGRTSTRDFSLQMKKLDRHFIKVAWAALLPTGELWIGDEGVTVHRNLRASRALGFTGGAPAGERRIHIRAVKRAGGER